LGKLSCHKNYRSKNQTDRRTMTRQNMEQKTLEMIYPGESSESQEESTPEGDPGCAGKVE
jgi:hypothetical protein